MKLVILLPLMLAVIHGQSNWRDYKKMSDTLTADVASAQLFSRFWEWRLTNAPEFATAIGNHQYDDRLDEMSLASYLRRQSAVEKFLLEVRDVLKITPSNSKTTFNLQLLEYDLDLYLKGQSLKPYLWPVNQLEGPQVDFPRLISWMKATNYDDFQKILHRFRTFPQQIEETIHLLEEGMRLGLVMHKNSITPAVAQLRNAANDSAGTSSYFKPFLSRPENISEVDWCSIVEEGRSLIVSAVLPSFNTLAEFLEHKYIPEARDNIAISSLPNGNEMYKMALKFHTTTDLTPSEIHDIGTTEVARISHLMEKVKNDIGFDGDLNSFRTYMRTDSKFKFKSSSEIVTHYDSVCAKISKILPTLFAKVPKSRYEIVPVPADIAPNFPGAYYLAGPEDGSRPGTFYINTYLPETRNRYEAMSLSLHEAEPGHHLQSALTMESEGLVAFRRFMEDRKYYEAPGRFAMNTAYVEGWGLYSEYLGEEMGLYNESSDMFGRLSHEMLRACRLVVDTGMHALGWSREKAIEYMKEHTAASEHDIVSEVDRYITWPGQACGYKIGELKIKELRNFAQSALAEKFSLKTFHDYLASMGGVPMILLEQKVKEFVVEHQKGNLVQDA